MVGIVDTIRDLRMELLEDNKMKVTLEHENGRRAIAIYKYTDIVVHHWLKDSDDEYQIFEIISDLVRKIE